MSSPVPSGLVAVTGATGAVGGRVARRLAAVGVPQRLVVRDASRAPELPGAEVAVVRGYDDAEGMRAALRGANSLFLVSGEESGDRVAEHVAAVDAAVAAGVSRVVYTSFLGAAPDATFTFARDHWHTEQHLQRTGMPSTSLRNSLYLDLMPMLVGDDGAIRGPAGDGRVSAVSRDDIADVATAVLLSDGEHDGQTYDVTGREALTLHEVAAQLSAGTGRDVRYVPETVEEAFASRAGYDAPAFAVEGWVSSYTAIAAGELSRVSDTVPRLTGHPAQTLREWLAAEGSGPR